MVKHRLTEQVKYGYFAEYYEVMEELNATLRSKGFIGFHGWAPVVGAANTVVYETDYPDLASFEKNTRGILTDSDCMKLIRRAAELVVQGTTHDELLEETYQIA